MDFAERLACLMEEKGLSNLKLSKETGLSDRLIGGWKKGEGGLNLTSAVLLADFFEVSVDFLAGRCDNREMGTKKEPALEISENGQEMLALYERLSERDQILLIGRLQEMVEPLLGSADKKVSTTRSNVKAV